MEDESVLKRELHEGDSVILSTGATAIARSSYPAGYAGDVEIALDGAEETECVSGITLPDPQRWQTSELPGASAQREPLDAPGTRARSRRMESP